MANLINSEVEFLAAVTGENDQDETLCNLLNQYNLIRTDYEKICENCAIPMYIARTASRATGYSWRCRNCKTYKTLRENSFFSEAKLKIWQILLLIFHWASESLKNQTAKLVKCSEGTVSNYSKRLRLIAIDQLNKSEIKLGGPGHIVEIDESLFVRVKHHRGADMHRPQVWVFGLYQRATATTPKKVLFFKVAKRDAVTLLNILYKHVEPETVVHSDCWQAYNHIVNLDKRYEHRTVNHTLYFVRPDGVHTNSIESMWAAAKRQFKRMNGVSRVYLQSYLDEYCWRLNNGNRNVWQILQAILRAISEYYNRRGVDANAQLDQSILEYNGLAGNGDDEGIEYDLERLAPDTVLELGDYKEFLVNRDAGVEQEVEREAGQELREEVVQNLRGKWYLIITGDA
jgi:transposase-like protein